MQFILTLFMSVLLLAACSSSTSDSNKVHIITHGDLTNIEISEHSGGKTWEFDSYQSKPVTLSLKPDARLSVKANSELHGCWFEGWKSEIEPEPDQQLHVTCHQKPVFKVVVSKELEPGPYPYLREVYTFLTRTYTFDEQGLHLIKETPSKGEYPLFAHYQVSKDSLFNTEEIIFEGTETKFENISDQNIEYVFFDPYFDKDTIFAVSSNEYEEKTLLALNETRTELQAVTLASDLSVEDFLPGRWNLYRDNILLNYHHKFDGTHLVSEKSYDLPDTNSLVNIPEHSDRGVSRTAIKYKEDWFDWETADGLQVIRRVISDDGTESTVTPVVLPEVEDIRSIIKRRPTGERDIFAFNCPQSNKHKRYYEYTPDDEWRLIINICGSEDIVSNPSTFHPDNEYMAIYKDPSYLVVNIDTGEVLEEFYPKRSGTGSLDYEDGILSTFREISEDCNAPISTCAYVRKIYFYSFERDTTELLLTTDPVRLESTQLPGNFDLVSSPISDIVETTGSPVDVRYKNLKFFIAYTAETGNEIWQTDGTPEGTKAIETYSPGPQSGVYYYRDGITLTPAE